MLGSRAFLTGAHDLPAERWRRWAVGFGVFLVATLLRLALQPLLGEQAPFLVHVAAVATAAWVGGVEGGLCAAVFSTLAVDYLFVTPRYTLKPGAVDHIAASALFVIVAVALVWQVGRWRRAEQALREGREDLNRAQNVARTGSWRLDVGRNELRWSDESYRMFGIPLGTPMTYDAFLAAVHPGDRDRVDQAWQAALRGARYEIDHRILVNGAVKWVHERAELEFDSRGRLRGGFGTVQEVSDRKHMEEALREQADRLQVLASLIEHAHDAICVRDGGEHITFWNRGAEHVYGWTAEEAIGRNAHALLGTDGLVLADLQSKLAETGEWQGELTHRRKDGGRVVMDSRHLRFAQADGASVILEINRDITDRKEAEDILQRYDLLAQHSRDIMLFVRRPDGRILEANEAAAQAYGYSREELRGLTIHDLRSPAASRVTEAQLNVADASGILFETEHRRRDGTLFPVEVSSRGATIRGERLLLSVVRDTTSRRRAEQALRESQGRLTALMDAATESIWLIDRRDVVVTANRTAARRLGMTVDEVVGRCWHDLVPLHVVAARRAHLAEVLETGRPVRFEDEREGLVFDHSFYPVCQPDGSVTAVAIFSRDVTEQKRADQALLESAKERERLYLQAEEANRTKDEFLATLSHELRTPLNTILGWSQMLATGSLPSDRQRQAIDVILRATKAQARLVEEVLDLSRIVSGKLHLDLQLVDVRSFIEPALETVALAAEAKQLTIDAALPTGVMMVGDAERLQQVMWNLVSNAVKFTPRGGRIAVSAARVDSHVEIHVSDTGIGISPEFLPHLFERFTQADSSRTRRYGGLGLGLAIVRHIVELHGGTMRAVSPGEGRGATFTLTLPITAVVPAAIARKSRPDSDAAPPRARALFLDGVKVLAVDDDPDSLQLLRTILAQNGATVMVAGSATEGMDTLRDFRPDVLVSDIGMPDEDGYVFIRDVRALAPDEGGLTPAIALTAYGHASDRHQALSAGYEEHLAKPVAPDELVSVIARVMRAASIRPSI